MKQISYWLDTASPSSVPAGSAQADSARTGLPMPGTADAVVVGAGLTGLSTAYHLALAGVRPVVLESHHVGWGASGRNGGMATTGLSISLQAAVKRFGERRAVEMRQFYNDAIDLIESISEAEGADAEFRRAGLMNLAARRGHLDHYRREAELIGSITPYEARFLDQEGVSEEIGSSAYFGGMIDPAGASVHPVKFLQALARGIERRGGVILEGVRVEGVEQRGAGHAVRTDRGTIVADQLVVATGAHSRRPFGWMQRRIAPVGSFVIVTEPLGAEVAGGLLPNRRVCSDSKELLNYFRLTEDDRLAFGGRARFMSKDIAYDRKSAEILQQQMVALFPQLGGARVEYGWGGLVDISMDRMVHSGTHDGWWYAEGYSGHGVQMATYMGKVLAGNVMGGTDNPWQDLPNPPIPGHLGWPWFVPVAGLYYVARDAVSR